MIPEVIVMYKRSRGFLISAAGFAVIMGFYLLRNWQWVTHSVAIVGYILLLLLLIGLGIVARIQENKQNSDDVPKAARSRSCFVCALSTAVFYGYVILMQWPYNDHAAALITYAAVIVMFLLLGLIARMRERKQQAA